MSIEVVSNEKPAEPKPQAEGTALGSVSAAAGETQTPPAPEAKAPERDASEDSGTPETEAQDTSETTDAESPDAEEAASDAVEGETKPKKKSGFQRKVNKLNARITAAQLEADYWKREALKNASGTKTEAPVDLAKPASKEGKPKPEDFESHELYLDARDDWNRKEWSRAAKADAEKDRVQSEWAGKQSTFNERLAAFKAKTPDYDEVDSEITDALMEAGLPGVSPTLQGVFVRSDNGPELAYQLAKDPSEFVRICKLAPMDAVRELGKFEATLALKASASKPETKKITTAPKPIAPVGSSGKAAVKMTLEEAAKTDIKAFKKMRNEAEALKRRRA